MTRVLFSVLDVFEEIQLFSEIRDQPTEKEKEKEKTLGWFKGISGVFICLVGG
jgi:hypothetical protein